MEFILGFLHLFSAIVFVGYVFLDAFLLERLPFANELKKAYFKSSGIIYAISFLILLISGVSLVLIKDFDYLNKFFIAKISLIFLMFIITLLSIFYVKIKNNKSHFLVIYAHFLAFVFCFFIVLFAKLMIIYN